MKVTSWNVNSIRSRFRRVRRWVEVNRPDVVALQETKTADADVVISVFDGLGYEVAHHGVDHWNGVAIASRVGLAEVARGFSGPNRAPFDEARAMSATCGGVRVWSVYAPNGRTLDDPHYLFKLRWFERLRSSLDTRMPTVVVGDFNVAPADRDIYDPTRWRGKTHASPAERDALESILDLGFRDVTREHLPDDSVFTWWSYRPGQVERNRGLRIDLALVSEGVADRVRAVSIDAAERRLMDYEGEKPSDHAPLTVTL